MRDSHNNTGFPRGPFTMLRPAFPRRRLVPPVYQTATYAFPTVEYGAACFAGEEAGHFYSRISNPTLALLEQRMASLEGGEAGLRWRRVWAPLPRPSGPCCAPVMN